MNKMQKAIIISSIFLLILVVIFNGYFILSRIKSIDFTNAKLTLNNYELNITYENDKKSNPNVINGGTVELTDIYNPLKISFSYTLDKTLVNNSNIKLSTSNKQEVPIIIKLEDKSSFLITPVNGSFMEDSVYTLTIKKELAGSVEKQILKDVEYNIQIKKLYLGADLFLTNKYDSLFKNKKIGLITNESGIDSIGESTLDKIYKSNELKLETIFIQKHGQNDTVNDYGVKAYNLYENTPNLTSKMLQNIDILVFDVQDLGINYNSTLSTLYKCMEGAKSKNKPIYILDRPNPLDGETIEGPIGTYALPLSYGMTIGEIANYFNKDINCNLTVIPMLGWYRHMTFTDCNLQFKHLSSDIKDIDAMYLYGTTGLSAGTNLNSYDNYHGVTMKNVDLNEISEKMNASNLKGAIFTVEKDKTGKNFIKINITDYKSFNPVETGIHLLAYGRIVGKDNFNVHSPELTKIMGTEEINQMLEEYKEPEEIIQSFKDDIDEFRTLREQYLIYK